MNLNKISKCWLRMKLKWEQISAKLVSIQSSSENGWHYCQRHIAPFLPFSSIDAFTFICTRWFSGTVKSSIYHVFSLIRSSSTWPGVATIFNAQTVGRNRFDREKKILVRHNKPTSLAFVNTRAFPSNAATYEFPKMSAIFRVVLRGRNFQGNSLK